MEVLEPLASELHARALAVDLSEPTEVDRLLSEAGELDILVANAALSGSGKLDSLTMQEIDRALEVNLRAPIAMAHVLAPEMVRRGSGHLLFMSSLSGKAATAGSSIYNATKFGLRGFAGAMRAELHGTGVGVSAVFPGFIREAGMFADAGVKLPKGVGTRSPEDVAKAVVEAIEHNRGEMDVAPIALRLGSAFAGLAPEMSAPSRASPAATRSPTSWPTATAPSSPLARTARPAAPEKSRLAQAETPAVCRPFVSSSRPTGSIRRPPTKSFVLA